MCAPRLKTPESPKTSISAPPAPANQTATQVGRSRSSQADTRDPDSGTIGQFDLRLPANYQILRSGRN